MYDRNEPKKKTQKIKLLSNQPYLFGGIILSWVHFLYKIINEWEKIKKRKTLTK